MKTKSGIEYNLKYSTYHANFDGVNFIFSSQLHLSKFLKQREINNKNISLSLTHRFKFDINAQILSDIYLYQKIETRGFLIRTDKGVYVSCLKSLKLIGGKLILKE